METKLFKLQQEDEKTYRQLKMRWSKRQPALALPTPQGKHKLYVDKKRGVAKGILVQEEGPFQ